MAADPWGREKPLRKTGRRSQASKRARARRVARADQRAIERFAVVDFALKALRENPELSLASCFALVKQAHSAGELTVSRFPGRASFYRWMKTALQKEGAPTIGDFADRPRSGRPRVSWHPAVVDRFEELVLSQIHPSLPLLYKELVTWAEQQEPKLPVPSIAAVRSRYNSIDFAALSAARHGRRAARADAIVKGAVPAEYPHQIWTLDEMDAPNWIKALNPQTGRLESVRPKVILVIDNYSRVVLACHVCEPFKGGEATVSFDSEDVLGTVLAATFRELASEACKPFTGFLPGDVRMDAANSTTGQKPSCASTGWARRVWRLAHRGNVAASSPSLAGSRTSVTTSPGMSSGRSPQTG